MENRKLAKESLKKASKLKDEFLANIVHELNLLQNTCKALKSKKEGIRVFTYVDNKGNVVIEI